MAVTFGFAVVVQLLWIHFRFALGDVTTLNTHHGVEGVQPLPPGAYLTDQSFLTGSGRALPWSTCAGTPTEKAHAACLAEEHIVGWSLKYFPISRMSAVQWSGAAVLLALTAAVVAFVLLRARKQLILPPGRHRGQPGSA